MTESIAGLDVDDAESEWRQDSVRRRVRGISLSDASQVTTDEDIY